MRTVIGLGIFVGTGQCNANCEHCAGTPHRKNAHKFDGEIDKELIEDVIRKCYSSGAKYISLTSSGEPTLSPGSVTKVLELIKNYEFVKYDKINLYTNGIVIGSDLNFCEKYLPLWKTLGLTNIYLTIHNSDEIINAKEFGIATYPNLKEIISRLKKYEYKVRANIVLKKNHIDTLEKFEKIALDLFNYGINDISVWPMRGLDDKVSIEIPPVDELHKIECWIKNNYNNKIRLLLNQDKIYAGGEKLTLFPDGKLSNKWCN